MIDSYIYFAQAFEGGPIKIGLSRNPEARVAQLSATSPFPLDLVAVIPGNAEFERHLHADFARFRLHGEWFSDAAPLARVIEVLIAPDLSNPLEREITEIIRFALEARRTGVVSDEARAFLSKHREREELAA